MRKSICCICTVFIILCVIWIIMYCCECYHYDYMDNVSPNNGAVSNDVPNGSIGYAPIGYIDDNTNGLLRTDYNTNGIYNDLRGLPLHTVHAYSRYDDQDVYDIISDTGNLIWKSNYDPRNYMNCDVVDCPNSQDTRFDQDVCLNCRPK